MKHIKIAAGLAHANYERIADLIREVSNAGIDHIYSDTADTHDFQDMKLMGDHQTIAGIRSKIDEPIECHIYTVSMDGIFIEQIDEAGADMLIIPTGHFIGAQLTYIINWCRERHIEVGLTPGCYTPLYFTEENIYDADRLHIMIHGADGADGKDSRGWGESTIDLAQRARKMVNERNPKCELVVDGDLHADNMDKLIRCNPDVTVLSSAIFKDPDGVVAGVKKRRAIISAAAEKYSLE